ncbi:MAG: Mth938-like domain-containing protein [Hyphomicrobiales bacterium]|nr:Mth938-like domain-containing protein [Hyphomicrobiales bacterium]
MSHRGSLLALPSGLYAWPVVDWRQIDEASLARVFAEPAGTIDHLLIGMGPDLALLPSSLAARLRLAAIVPEPMATGAAARTYNILLGEGRLVAAALIAV